MKLGNLTALLDVIAPAADEVPGFDGTRTSKNEAFVQLVAEQNVRRMMKRVRQDSPSCETSKHEVAFASSGACTTWTAAR